METGVLTTQRRHCANPYNTSLVLDGFLYQPMDCCYEVHMKVFSLPPPPFGVRPPAPVVLALLPDCCGANPLLLASSWATSLWLNDLAVCRTVSVVAAVIDSSHPPPHHSPPSGLWLAGLAKEEREQRIMGWDMASVGEKLGLSLATSQLIENPAANFWENRKLFSL